MLVLRSALKGRGAVDIVAMKLSIFVFVDFAGYVRQKNRQSTCSVTKLYQKKTQADVDMKYCNHISK